MTKPDPAPAKPKREKATWTVYERIEHANVFDTGPTVGNPLGEDVTALVERANNVTARTGADACWWVAENALKDRAQSDTPPVLCASRNGTAHGLTEARPYALKATVERVK